MKNICLGNTHIKAIHPRARHQRAAAVVVVKPSVISIPLFIISFFGKNQCTHKIGKLNR